MTVQFSSQAIAALSASPLRVQTDPGRERVRLLEIGDARLQTGLNVAPPLQDWQTITLGTYKGADAYRDVMDAAGIKIRDSANEILGRPDFPYAMVKTEVELALLSISELGVESESSLSEVYKRAQHVGLGLCPPEVGPQLRLHYRNQPVGEALNIAMKPIATYGGDPTILALVNFGSGLALEGVDGRSEFMVIRTSRFVFAFPTKRALTPIEMPIQTKRGTGSCPDCGTRVIAAPCRTCSGTGRSLGLFRCRGCNGEGEKTVCPNFLTHMRAQFASPSLAANHAATT